MLVKAPVLVLNQNYQPLNICDVRRAMSLLGKGKAEQIEDTGEYIHTAFKLFAMPSIIRLFYLVKRPLHRRKLSRREIFARDRYCCGYCGYKTRELTLDHIIPRSRGGEHICYNIVSACKRCNQSKAGRTPREARMTLQVLPKEPRPNPYAIFYPGRILENWLPYLPWIEPDPFEVNI